jgi:hypothetical protein
MLFVQRDIFIRRLTVILVLDIDALNVLDKLLPTKKLPNYLAGKEEKTPYIVLMDLYYKDGSIPFSKETILLRKHKEWKYKGKKFLRTGNSELFAKDILGLDSNQLSLCEVLV